MIFLRHPTPEIAQGICYGRTDMDIAKIGHNQIEKALNITPKFDHIFASPALRCRKLAENLSAREQLTIEFDERLWEMDMGDWEGVPWKDIDRDLSNAWLKNPLHNTTPNGECFADLQSRVGDFLNEITGNLEAHRVAIICHAGPIRATQMAMENITFEQAFAQVPPYAEPVEIDFRSLE